MSEDLKGYKGGKCNITSCNLGNAQHYNHSTKKYYCWPCAKTLNMENRTDAMRLYGHDLCTLEPEEKHQSEVR